MTNPAGTERAAAIPLSTTMKNASVTAKMTFCRKPMPKAKMNTGRKIDFGIDSSR